MLLVLSIYEVIYEPKVDRCMCRVSFFKNRRRLKESGFLWMPRFSRWPWVIRASWTRWERHWSTSEMNEIARWGRTQTFTTSKEHWRENWTRSGRCPFKSLGASAPDTRRVSERRTIASHEIVTDLDLKWGSWSWPSRRSGQPSMTWWRPLRSRREAFRPKSLKSPNSTTPSRFVFAAERNSTKAPLVINCS